MIEQIVKYIILPSNVIVLLFISGFVLFLKRKSRKYSNCLWIVAVVVYIVFSTGPISFWLLGNLEYQYPYLKNTETITDIENIVVLTGFSEEDILLPLSSRVNDASAYRLIEALRTYQKIPKSRILITGSDIIPSIMKELLVEMGVSPDNITVENNSRSTFESAENVSRLIENKKFILVTSAGHMPRSMYVFEKSGMNPVPAPTHYLTRKNNMAISYLPSPLHLIYSDLAIHEYAGILWYRIKNWI